MRVEITTRHCDLSDHLKQRVSSRMEKLLRFDDGLKDARVVVNFEKNRYSAEAMLQANGGQLISRAVEESKKAALEQVLNRLEAQVKKQRDRNVKTKKRATPRREPVAAAVAAAPGEEPDEAVEEAFGDDSDFEGLVSEEPGDFSVEMPLGEAVAQLRASRRETLGFTNRATGRPLLLFKRRDGNIGMVEVGG